MSECPEERQRVARAVVHLLLALDELPATDDYGWIAQDLREKCELLRLVYRNPADDPPAYVPPEPEFPPAPESGCPRPASERMNGRPTR